MPYKIDTARLESSPGCELRWVSRIASSGKHITPQPWPSQPMPTVHSLIQRLSSTLNAIAVWNAAEVSIRLHTYISVRQGIIPLIQITSGLCCPRGQCCMPLNHSWLCKGAVLCVMQHCGCKNAHRNVVFRIWRRTDLRPSNTPHAVKRRLCLYIYPCNVPWRMYVCTASEHISTTAQAFSTSARAHQHARWVRPSHLQTTVLSNNADDMNTGRITLRFLWFIRYTIRLRQVDESPSTRTAETIETVLRVRMIMLLSGSEWRFSDAQKLQCRVNCESG